jgi:hypothetical protein
MTALGLAVSTLLMPTTVNYEFHFENNKLAAGKNFRHTVISSSTA